MNILRFVLLGSWLLAAAAATPSQAYTRVDPPGGDYFIGYFAWNDGVGTIHWAPGDSEDPGGAREADKDVFVSDPVPRTLHINASRLIQLDLFTKGRPTGAGATSCQGSPSIGGELYAGSKLLGGIFPGGVVFDKSAVFPADPPDHGTCRIRIQAELGVIEKGTVLTVKLPRSGDVQEPLYGMRDEHRSVLRIPFFSDREMPYRYPSYPHAGPAMSDPAKGPTAWLLGAALLMPGLRSPVRGRRERSALALVLLLGAGSLAGCTGGRNDPSRDPADEAIEASYQAGELSGAGMGSIIGEVTAKASGQPLQGAFVSLLGTDRSERTDPYGRFVFPNLTAGTYRIHVDATGYNSFDGTATVVADLIARVRIALVEVRPPERVFDGHPHDYWGTRTQITLMDHVNLGPGRSGFVIPPQPPEFWSILPGAYDVNITVELDSPTVDPSIRLGFLANNEPSGSNITYMMARLPGVPFHIATTWEMGDPGHQRFSGWAFTVAGAGAGLSGNDLKPDQLSPEKILAFAEGRLFPTQGAAYIVTLTISKGVVPLEPVHPDAWGGKNTLDNVRDESQPVHRVTPSTDVANAVDAARLRDPSRATLSQPYGWNNAWMPDRPIPAETLRLEVYANASRDLLPSYGVELRVKTAASGVPSGECVAGAAESGSACDGFGYTSLGVGTVVGRSSHWAVPAVASENDPFYATRSFWVFGLSTVRDAATDAGNAGDYAAHDLFGDTLDYSLTVISHRAPGEAPATP